MKVEIISIGDDLLVSDVLDTCSAHLSRSLWEMGISITCKVTVGEELSLVMAVLRTALVRADLVLAIASVHEEERETLRTAVARLRHAAAEEFTRHTYVLLLEGYSKLSLPELWDARQGNLLLGLPRDRMEFSYLWDTTVFPFLQAHFPQMGTAPETASLLLRAVGIAESSIRSQLADLGEVTQTRITYDSFAGQTNIRLWAFGRQAAEAQQQLAKLRQLVLQQVGDYIYGTEQDRLEQVLLLTIRQQKLRLALAECHTNQVFARTLTHLPGSDLNVVVLPGNSCGHLARHLDIDPPAEDLSGWCRAAATRMLQHAGSDVSLLVMKNVSPGGVQIMVVLASASGVSITQRSFGGHPESIDHWALSLGMAHLRFWLQARAQLLPPQFSQETS